MRKTETVIAVSGGFDPIHIGHVRMFEQAKKLGTYLVVILNNDNWLRAKKGFVFMPEGERAEIIKALRSVDKVVITSHKPRDPDRGVVRELCAIKPQVFANGGDRTKKTMSGAETVTCRKLGIRMAFGVGGGKVQSSSWLAAAVQRKK